MTSCCVVAKCFLFFWSFKASFAFQFCKFCFLWFVFSNKNNSWRTKLKVFFSAFYLDDVVTL